jgi:hypothetical protein
MTNRPGMPTADHHSREGPATEICRVGSISCAFYRVRDEADARHFIAQSRVVGAWYAGLTDGRSDTLLSTTLEQRLAAGEPNTEWREILVAQHPLRDRPGYLEILIYHWHDTATWLVEVSCDVSADPGNGLAAADDALDALPSPPPFDRSADQFIGQTVFTRIVGGSQWTHEEKAALARAWLRRIMPGSGAEVGLLHSSFVHGHADLYVPAIPAADQPDAPWPVLQLVTPQNDRALDALTGNQFRQMESYAHKIERLVSTYPGIQEALYAERATLEQELQTIVQRWLEQTHTLASEGHSLLRQVRADLDLATGRYLALSTASSRIREARTAIHINLGNLENRMTQLDTGQARGDGIYTGRIAAGRRSLHQIDGDLQYADATLHEAATVLATMGSRLEIIRGEQAHEETRRDEERERELLREVQRESVILKVLTYGLIGLSTVLVWGLFLEGLARTDSYGGLPKGWALVIGIVLFAVSMTASWWVTRFLLQK